MNLERYGASARALRGEESLDDDLKHHPKAAHYEVDDDFTESQHDAADGRKSNRGDDVHCSSAEDVEAFYESTRQNTIRLKD